MCGLQGYMSKRPHQSYRPFLTYPTFRPRPRLKSVRPCGPRPGAAITKALLTPQCRDLTPANASSADTYMWHRVFLALRFSSVSLGAVNNFYASMSGAL